MLLAFVCSVRTDSAAARDPQRERKSEGGRERERQAEIETERQTKTERETETERDANSNYTCQHIHIDTARIRTEFVYRELDLLTRPILGV